MVNFEFIKFAKNNSKLMTITVLAVFDEFNHDAPLARVLKERLMRLAKELEQKHLNSISALKPLLDDVVVYISYGPSYAVRWKIVNDVPDFVEQEIARKCALLGYNIWKTNRSVIFRGRN